MKNIMKYKKHRFQMARGIRANSPRREPETIQWIESMSPGQVIYDVGACVGAYSLIAAANQIVCYAFEPMIGNFTLLLRNIISNKFVNRIMPMAIPLSDEQKLGKFNYRTLNKGDASHSFDSVILHKNKKRKPVFSQLTLSSTIDLLVGEHKLPAPNFIKIDVDGIESRVIKGGLATIRDSVSSVLVESMDDASRKDITFLFSSCNMVLSKRESSDRNLVYRKNDM